MSLSGTPRVWRLLVLMGLMAACSGRGGMDYTPERLDAGVTLRVENNNWQDIAVYAIASANRHRLGTVTTASRDTFRIPSTVLGTGGFRVLLYPIGGGPSFMTEEIVVEPGAHVEMEIENLLPLTGWRIR